MFKLSNYEIDLKDFYTPEFDIFKVRMGVSQENVLPLISAKLYNDFNMNTIIPSLQFKNYINIINEGYAIPNNAYHNEIHGADVA